MAYFSQKEYTFAYPPSTVARGDGGFAMADEEVIGRWVTWYTASGYTAGQVKLVEDDEPVLGIITRMDKNGVGVAVGPRLRGPRSGNAAIEPGRQIVGGPNRQVAATGSAEPGYIKGSAAPQNAAQLTVSRGRVINGGGTTTANTPAAMVDVLMV